MTIIRLTNEEINRYADNVYLKAKQRLGEDYSHEAFRVDLIGG